MGSDRARASYDPQQQYRGVVMQQGRVTLEADWNEQLQIATEEQRAEALDIVGPSGTPDDGYTVSAGTPALGQYDFVVGPGTMYVGGVRVEAPPSGIKYSAQTDWLDGHPSNLQDPYWVDPTQQVPGGMNQELICLMLREQEVSAVEDGALREVALGGPDTAQRLRLLQRVVRFGTNATDCSGALADAETHWLQDGLTFNAPTMPQPMRLLSSATLQASYQPPTNPPDNCQPDGRGGYLEADNQLIRVQIADQNTILWGFDDASFLYRVDVVEKQPPLQTLHLQSRPVDAYHQPRAGQVVEVMRSAAQLHNREYIASATGFPVKLSSPYDPDSQQISLAPAMLPQTYGDSNLTPRVFLRVWEDQLAFTPGTAVALGQTGLQVTLQLPAGSKFHVGDYWLIAVRPSTPQQVYPRRLLDSPQLPDGPRMWACPLAVINWAGEQVNVLPDGDCRNHFCRLVEACRARESACCTISVRPEDLDAEHTLQAIVDALPSYARATICLAPGTCTLPAPLRIGPEHSNLTIEGCHNGVVLQAAADSMARFADGLIVLTRANDVTLRNLRFELPLAPFGASKVRLTHLEAADTSAIPAALLESLLVSIGVRPIHCARLTIADCLFRFALAPERPILGAGIFASSECWGLTVRGNRFVREEDYLRSTQGLFRFLLGYLLAPATASRVTRAQLRAQASAGAVLLRPLLDDAVFRDNQFEGLTHAALINADAGTVAVEDNSVRDCESGFVFVSLTAMGFVELLAQVIGDQRLAVAEQLGRVVPVRMIQALVSTGNLLARHYPLPPEFDAREGTRIPALKGDAAAKQAVADRARIRTLLMKAFTLFGGSIPSRQAGEGGKPVAPPERQAMMAPIHQAEQQVNLSAFQRAVLVREFANRQGLRLSLHVENNDISALVPMKPAKSQPNAFGPYVGIGVLVWNHERAADSAVVMSANRVRNQDSQMPTAAILNVARCAVTGNLITNEQSGGTQQLTSLVIYVLGHEMSATAVTSNVCRGKPVLPPRMFPPGTPTPPPPMNTWEFLNSIT